MPSTRVDWASALGLRPGSWQPRSTWCNSPEGPAAATSALQMPPHPGLRGHRCLPGCDHRERSSRGLRVHPGQRTRNGRHVGDHAHRRQGIFLWQARARPNGLLTDLSAPRQPTMLTAPHLLKPTNQATRETQMGKHPDGSARRAVVKGLLEIKAREHSPITLDPLLQNSKRSEDVTARDGPMAACRGPRLNPSTDLQKEDVLGLATPSAHARGRQKSAKWRRTPCRRCARSEGPKGHATPKGVPGAASLLASRNRRSHGRF